jgi:hypothetical protein
MAPLFARTLASKNKKFIVVAKWPDREEEINKANAHQGLIQLNESTHNVLLFKGQVVSNQLIAYGKEKGYAARTFKNRLDITT